LSQPERVEGAARCGCVCATCAGAATLLVTAACGVCVTGLVPTSKRSCGASAPQKLVSSPLILLRYLSRTQSRTKRFGAYRASVLSLSSACNGRIHILNSVAGNSSCNRARHCCQSESDTADSTRTKSIMTKAETFMIVD